MKNFLRDLFPKPDERIPFVSRMGEDNLIVKVAGVETVIDQQTYSDALKTLKILDDYLENARTLGQKVVELIAENDSLAFFVILKSERHQIRFPINGEVTCERCSKTHFVTSFGLRPLPFPVDVESNYCLSCHREESNVEDYEDTNQDIESLSINELTGETPHAIDTHVDTPKSPPVTTHQEREEADESSLGDFARSLQQGLSEPQALQLGQSDDATQQKEEVFGKVGRELVRKYRELISSQRTYTLKRGKILDRWSTVILNGQGHEDKIIALTAQLLE